MVHRSFQHLHRAGQMEAQVAVSATPNLFSVILAAVKTVRVRPEMEHRRIGDVAAAGEQRVERFAAVRVTGEQVNTAGGADDVLGTNVAALGPNTGDLTVNDAIDAIVVAGQNGVTLPWFICRMHFSSSTVVEGTVKIKD